mmetsp:Transcript_36260/g.85942  ORF Transcript_36260/g.85942 Transcript_36260/m.85942 type:complete len:327 (+) Transcript_36260:258-1238(+)
MEERPEADREGEGQGRAQGSLHRAGRDGVCDCRGGDAVEGGAARQRSPDRAQGGQQRLHGRAPLRALAHPLLRCPPLPPPGAHPRSEVPFSRRVEIHFEETLLLAGGDCVRAALSAWRHLRDQLLAARQLRHVQGRDDVLRPEHAAALPLCARLEAAHARRPPTKAHGRRVSRCAHWLLVCGEAGLQLPRGCSPHLLRLAHPRLRPRLLVSRSRVQRLLVTIYSRQQLPAQRGYRVVCVRRSGHNSAHPVLPERSVDRLGDRHDRRLWRHVPHHTLWPSRCIHHGRRRPAHGSAHHCFHVERAEPHPGGGVGIEHAQALPGKAENA